MPAVRCATKPEQSYAVYVPSNYTANQRWPIVYVFDPGARGKLPIELMKSAAERYGFLLAGSNNSRNGPWKPELDAAQAMWDDTRARLSIDDRRVYFAGFSGGARVAAQLAQACKCAHGVFLNGAGFAVGSPPSREAVFPVFAAVGMTDFNYGELVQLDAQLETLGFPHILRRFDGPHRWPPAAVWEEALAWMTLIAMKDGRRPRDDAFVAAELDRALQRSRELEVGGDSYFAWETYRELAAVFDGLVNNTALKERASVLEKNSAMRAAAKREKAEIEKQQLLQADILGVTNRIRTELFNRDALQGEAEAQIRRLREDAGKEARIDTRRALERAQEGVFIAMMETGGSLLEAKDYASARLYLELAAEARPDSSWPHVSLARCLLLLGKRKDALRELKRARKTGLSAAALTELSRQVPELAPLAGDPEFQKLLADAAPAPTP